MNDRFACFEKFLKERGMELQPWQRYAARLVLSNTRVWIERPRCNGRRITAQVRCEDRMQLPPMRVLKRRFESRMDARGRMDLALETREWIAEFLQAARQGDGELSI